MKYVVKKDLICGLYQDEGWWYEGRKGWFSNSVRKMVNLVGKNKTNKNFGVLEQCVTIKGKKTRSVHKTTINGKTKYFKYFYPSPMYSEEESEDL